MLKTLFLSLLLTVTSLSAQELMTVVKEDKAASDFTLKTPEGNDLSLSDYAGKYVLINFWAYWCSPCLKEFPDMQKLYENVDKDKFEIIGIHAGPYNSEAADFVNHFGITFPIVSDPDTSLKGWDIPALPMTYLINPDGKVVYQAIGPRTWDLDQMRLLISQ